MKKKVISALSILWKIAIPLLSAVIGLKIVEKFNVFQILHIIDDADKAFDVCTTVYFAIVDVALLSFAEWIKNTFFTPQTIQVTLSNLEICCRKFLSQIYFFMRIDLVKQG